MRSLLPLAALLPSALAFSFSYTAPTSCDPLTLIWAGGVPPFSLLLTPALDIARNFSIPADAFSAASQTGNYTTSLPLPQGNTFLITMSDSTGFGTGGTSQLLTVGPSSSGSACNTAGPDLGFNFYITGAPAQCQTLGVSWDANATDPVSVWGLIPLGEVFKLATPAQGTTYDWTVNIVTGTSFFLLAYDSSGNEGGTSSIQSVGASDTSACIDASSPSSTVNSQPSQTSMPSPTASGSGSAASSTPTSSPTAAAGSTGTSAGTVAGAVVGSLALLAILASLAFFLLRRRWRHQRLSDHSPSTFHKRPVLPGRLGTGLSGGGGGGGGMIDLLPNPSHSSLPRAQSYEPVPFLVPPLDGGSAEGSWEGAGADAGSTLPRQTVGTWDDPFSSRSRTRSSTGAGTELYNPYAGYAQTTPSTQPSMLPPPPDSPSAAAFLPAAAGPSAPGRPSKRQEARAQAQPARRYVLHTDAGSLGEGSDEEVVVPAGAEQEVVVELPPAYDPGFARGRRVPPPPEQQPEGGQDGGEGR